MTVRTRAMFPRGVVSLIASSLAIDPDFQSARCRMARRTVSAQQERSVVWDRIDTTVELREDSSFHITERDEIDFIGGPFRSGYREIPIARIEGFDNVRVGEVIGNNVQPYRYVPPRDFSNSEPNTYTFRNGRFGSARRLEFPLNHFGYTHLRDRVRRLWSPPRLRRRLDPPYQQISWIGVDRDI